LPPRRILLALAAAASRQSDVQRLMFSARVLMAFILMP